MTVCPTSLWRFNTQPRGGGCVGIHLDTGELQVSTLSRAEAAAIGIDIATLCDVVSTLSRAEAAASDMILTAQGKTEVSTLSRAEAAAYGYVETQTEMDSFNTQPRGGGCIT